MQKQKDRYKYNPSKKGGNPFTQGGSRPEIEELNREAERVAEQLRNQKPEGESDCCGCGC